MSSKLHMQTSREGHAEIIRINTWARCSLVSQWTSWIRCCSDWTVTCNADAGNGGWTSRVVKNIVHASSASLALPGACLVQDDFAPLTKTRITLQSELRGGHRASRCD